MYIYIGLTAAAGTGAAFAWVKSDVYIFILIYVYIYRVNRGGGNRRRLCMGEFRCVYLYIYICIHIYRVNRGGGNRRPIVARARTHCSTYTIERCAERSRPPPPPPPPTPPPTRRVQSTIAGGWCEVFTHRERAPQLWGLRGLGLTPCESYLKPLRCYDHPLFFYMPPGE